MVLPVLSSDENQSSLFSLRGSLDGAIEQEFTNRVQYIGVIIGREEFYLAIAAVAEIIMLQPITYVSRANKFIEGVVNLRGTIMPAINLRKVLGVEKGQPSAATRIIIVKNDKNYELGFIVDSVTYVSSLAPSDVEAKVLYGDSSAAEVISGIAKSQGKVIGILDEMKIIARVCDNDGKKISQAG